MTTRPMPYISASPAACIGPPPPNASSAQSRPSIPRSTVTRRSARAMVALATVTTPSAVSTRPSPSASAIGCERALGAADVEHDAVAEPGRRVEVAEDRVGVGDGGQRAAAAVAGRARVRARRCPARPSGRRGRAARPSRRRRRWSAPPASAGAAGGRPACAVSVISAAPSTTRHTSVVVPPMSKVSARAKPSSRAMLHAGGRRRRPGRTSPWRSAAPAPPPAAPSPPAEWNTCKPGAERQPALQFQQIVQRDGHGGGVERGGGGALVFPRFRVDLVRHARHAARRRAARRRPGVHARGWRRRAAG